MTMFGSQWLANPDVTYEIDNSCIFNDDDTAYLTRTQDTGDSQQIGTFSWWMKRCSFGAEQAVIAAGASSRFMARFSEGDELTLRLTNETTEYTLTTNMVFRDPSAWYHCVWRIDVTQGTAADRSRFYVNGSAVTFDGSSLPAQDTDVVGLGDATTQRIGILSHSTAASKYDGYLAEFYCIDNASLDASSFGETNSDGVWVPKKFSGTFGTNGFFLEFGTDSALGDDTSGNSNDLTSSGLAAADQRVDTPTNNQITYNTLNNQQSGGTLTDGNLVYNGPSTRTLISLSANIPTTGKYAVAFTASVVSTNAGWNFGITKSTNSNFGDAAGSNEDVGAPSDGIAMSPSSSDLALWDYVTTGEIDPSLPITTSDEYWMAVDMATGKCFLGIYDDSATSMIWVAADAGVDGNPVDGSNPTTTITDMIGSYEYVFAAAGSKGNADLTLKRSTEVSGTLPSGYTYFENIKDFPAPTIKDPSAQFQAELYTGNGTAIGSGGKAVTFTGNSSLSPDLVWIKNRDTTDDHAVYDTTRGTTKQIEPNNNDAQTTETEGLTTFGSDGFTVGDLAQLNTNTEDYVSWNWAEGATPGFDIVTWTGSGVARTISHSLSAVPKMMIVKGTAARDWMVYHVASNSTPEDYYLRLDTSAAAADEATIWNDTAPTSSVFSVGTGNGVNADTETYVGYLFTNVEGFSKFGPYTGNNNADGTSVYCGFKPRFLIAKKIASGNWMLSDTARNTYNPAATLLFPSTTDADTTGTDYIDFLSNGFKLRHTGGLNAAVDYIFMAFAENPFGGSGVAPATAR